MTSDARQPILISIARHPEVPLSADVIALMRPTLARKLRDLSDAVGSGAANINTLFVSKALTPTPEGGTGASVFDLTITAQLIGDRPSTFSIQIDEPIVRSMAEVVS